MSGRGAMPLTGFDVLVGRRQAAEVPAPDTLPPRLREVDLNLAAERARAVDPLELAAYLEADGLSDEVLRGRYGVPGLFEAAELLYAQRGTGAALRRRGQTAAPTFPWPILLRGPLYLLPGVTGLIVAGALGGGAPPAFAFAAALGWGHALLISALRYGEPLGVPGRALRAALLAGGGAGLVGGAVTAGLLAGVGQVTLGALVGGSVALAGGAAGVLLALGRTRLFAGAFSVPLLTAGAVFAVPSAPAALVTLGLLAGVPTLAALHATRTPGSLRLTPAVLLPALRLAAYGWALAAAFVALAGRLGTGTLLPLVLTAGLLEAGVWHAQERLQHVARGSRDLAALRRRGRLTVLATAAGYALALAGGEAVLRSFGVPLPPPIVVPALGAALLLGAWLANHGRAPLLLGLWLAAAAVLTLNLLPLPVLAPLLALALLPPTLRALHDPRSYR